MVQQGPQVAGSLPHCPSFASSSGYSDGGDAGPEDLCLPKHCYKTFPHLSSRAVATDWVPNVDRQYTDLFSDPSFRSQCLTFEDRGVRRTDGTVESTIITFHSPKLNCSQLLASVDSTNCRLKTVFSISVRNPRNGNLRLGMRK